MVGSYCQMIGQVLPFPSFYTNHTNLVSFSGLLDSTVIEVAG